MKAAHRRRPRLPGRRASAIRPGPTASRRAYPSTVRCSARRLPPVTAPNDDLAAAAGRADGLPLAVLLGHAADALRAVQEGRSLTAVLAQVDAGVRPGTQALAFHALRWLGSARAVRVALAARPPPPAADALLLVALALLWPADARPYADHTVVDQVVRAARGHRDAAVRAAAPFVNAVLRRFLREREAQVAAAGRTAEGRWNHPAWWVERLRADWPAQWQQVLAADNARPPLTLRVNARRTDTARMAARLAAAGIASSIVGPQAIALAEPRPVAHIPGFAEGDVSVQDAAAQLAAPLLVGAGLARGARVLDACAAPGGKSAHLLELADCDLLAIDSDAARLARVDDTLRRLGLAARTLVGDAAEPAAWWDGVPFDAILLDAPCTASGIVRRHPDIRWLRRASDIAALARTQARLLDALWPLLAPGGRLLYCTCSVFRAEGSGQIDAFLQRRADACHADSPPSPGHLLPLADNSPADAAGSRQAPAADGFFHALLERTATC